MEEDFDVGDLVWAKMKRYPFWPGRVEEPPSDKLPKKAHHYIFFFGTENCAWVSDEFIVHHSDERVKLSPKKKSSKMQSAIDEIITHSQQAGKKSSPQDKESAIEDAETPPRNTAQFATGKKYAKVVRKVLVPPKEKPMKVPKKVQKKRNSTDSGINDHLPVAKSIKVEIDSEDVLSAEDSPSGYSNSYDGDSASCFASEIPTRADYIERPSTPIFDMKVSGTLLSKNITPTDKKIGFLGLGMMGRGVVKNLLHSRHDVTVWNRTRNECMVFVNAGAKLGATPYEVVAQCDIIFSCVSDPEAAKQLIFGKDGVLQGMEGSVPGSKGYIEMSSIDPSTSKDIAVAITLVGGRYLEAPISGSRQLAEEGALLILGAGDRDLFNDCESCFTAFAKNAYYLSSSVGMGSKMNLILSMLAGTTIAALAEALALVERYNLSPSIFLEILSLCPLNSSLLLEKGQVMRQRNFSTNTALKHQDKDMVLALSLSDQCDQPLFVGAAASKLYKNAKRRQYADHDVSAVIQGAKF